MYSSPQYTATPGYGGQYAYRATPMKSAPYYTTYTYSTPTKGHARRASHEPSSYQYATPKQAYWASPAAYTPYYTSTTHSSPKRSDPVSPSEREMRSKAEARRYATYDGMRSSPSKQDQYCSSRAYYYDEDEGYHSYGKGGSPPPPYDEDAYSHRYRGADYHARHQVHVSSSSSPSHERPPPNYRHSARGRATSHPSPPQEPSPSKQRPTTATREPPPPREATAADAVAAGIPAGYSLKNWDPTEEPILLLGSVFDANTLGRWIYDWTVFHHGPATPMADMAGDLWLLLIQLAGKVKRAEEALPRIRHSEDRDLVEDFLESGERLWSRFGKILKICEDYMWRSAKKDAARKGVAKPAAMGPKSGCEFVDSIFGRDRQLESSEKLMQGMRLWSMRFDANCEDILRRPGA